VERKFTFESPQNIWKHAYDLYDRIASNELIRFIPEFEDEFQVWDYESLLFQLSENKRSKGYIAFIPQSDGKVTVKIKYFEADAETRREVLESNQKIHARTYESYAKRRTGLQPKYLCTFRRTRFDINIESIETGNIFSVLFDICRSLDSPIQPLSQCEVEYVRSRSLRSGRYISEFERLCAFVSHFLAERGVITKQDKRSKLTHFLGE
jgi:hypothetical protein